MKIELSDSGTLIIPVPKERFAELPDILPMGKQVFYKKAEHHMTVFNYPIGKKVLSACRGFPQLHSDINQVASIFDWTFVLNKGSLMYLRSGTPKNIKTIITMISTECVNKFYSSVLLLLDRAVHEDPNYMGKLDLIETLRTLLRVPPPPHITIYTSDPEGKKGIGLNSWEELVTATANHISLEPVDTVMTAFPLDPEIIW